MDIKKKALIKHLGLTTREDIKAVESCDYDIFEYYNEEYEVLTEDEADDRWDEELDNCIENCILPEIPEFCRRYFDSEAWKRDARFDGRGQAISRYDGCENEETVNGITFYIYRQN